VRYTLALLICIAGCASQRYSTLRLVSSSFSESDSLGRLRIDIQGLDPRLAPNAQVSLYRTGPDTLEPPRSRWSTYRAFTPIDSLRPGSYEVRVQLLGYSPATLDITIRAGEVVKLLARMRESRIQLRSVTS